MLENKNKYIVKSGMKSTTLAYWSCVKSIIGIELFEMLLSHDLKLILFTQTKYFFRILDFIFKDKVSPDFLNP